MLENPKNEIFIEKAIVKHGYRYGYSKVNYVKSTDLVEIICHVHGSFWQTPKTHLKGSGCRDCANIQRGLMCRKPSKDFFDALKISIRHGQIYGTDRVEYETTTKKVWLNCPVHGYFKITPEKFMSGQGCKDCANIQSGLKRRNDSQEFFDAVKSSSRHGLFYGVDRVVYEKKDKKVTLHCQIHGYFEISPEKFMSGQGCNDCGKIQSGLKKRKDPNEFWNAVKTSPRHGQLYGTDRTVYITKDKKVILHCPIHGYFKISPEKFMAGQGCNDCGNITIGLKKRKDSQEFFDAVNSSLRYGLIYGTDKTEYTTKKKGLYLHCPDHGYFKISPEKFMSGQSCFQCSRHCGKRNLIYFWGDKDGSDIYKFGISSSQKGDSRIKQVSSKAKISPEIIRIKEVEYARPLESQLLKLGIPVDFSEKFDGHSEFRRLTTEEVRLAIDLIDQAF